MIDRWRARPAEMRALIVVALVLEVVAFGAGQSVVAFGLLSGLALGVTASVVVWNLSRRQGAPSLSPIRHCRARHGDRSALLSVRRSTACLR